MKKQREERNYSSDNTKYSLKNNFKKPKTLEEYFILIGVDPIICTNKDLYISSINELNENYSKLDFKPKILSKFPPINKEYINIDETIIDMCFSEGYKLYKFNEKPEPIFQHFILDNSFFSIEYPIKYVSCLKIFESLQNYFLLKEQMKENYNKNKEDNILKINEINNSSNNFSDDFDISNNDFKNYYFPKVLCLISTQNFFKEQEEILMQIYQYYLDKNIKKRIPLEKKILTILCNIPLPPKGTLEIEYNLMEEYKKIKLRNQKMNKLPIIQEEINLIFNKFDTKTFLEIFKYNIFETKILVFSSNINELSYFIHGLICLLFPFHYSFQISSSLPHNAYSLIESISPYILGINKIYKKSFFKENRIDIHDIDLLIIDLDKCNIKFNGNRIIPEIPKNLLKPLYEGLNNINKIKPDSWNKEEKHNNYKIIRRLFYDFFVILMNNYDLYIKYDYFKNNMTNLGINNLFKIDEFINSHSNNDRIFYRNFAETQMFCDFIYKKMIPKDINQKLETLFFDESIIKKNNLKLFSKKKSYVFLISKDYDFNNKYEVPQSKALSQEEKNFFINEEDNQNLLSYGQKVHIEFNKETKEEEYIFDYYLFPILNKSFFESPPPGEYFLKSESILFSNIDLINNDILSRSLLNSSNNTNKNINEQEMKNYIYLSYIQLWAYNYWYWDSNEKEKKFKELLNILSKISFYEVELFDTLFESLNKFKDKNKILKIYDFFLKNHISPSSYIYQTVNSYLKNLNLKKSSSCKNIFNNNNILVNNIILDNKICQKKTFHSIKDGQCLGDKIKFFNKQKCPECGQDIDITEICLNFKNMRKDFFWAKCPNCENYILPKLGVILGTEIISKEKSQNIYNNYYSSNYTKFILHSPYELKINLKKIKKKDGFKMFHIEYFKQEYASLFWSCVWFFKIYGINLDILLPYEWNINQEIFNSEKYIPQDIVSKVYLNNSKNYIYKRDIKPKKIKKRKNKKKYLNDDLIIHSVISTTITHNDEKDKSISYYDEKDKSISYYTKQFSDDSYRKYTNTSSNKSTNYSGEILFNKSRENSVLSKSNINTLNSYSNIPSRVRLNTLTNSHLLSPTFKSRQLYDSRNTNNFSLISIEENEECIVTFPQKYKKENHIFLEKKSISNYNDDKNSLKLNEEFMARRKRTFEKIKKYKIIDYNNNNRNNSAIISQNQNFLC